MKARELSGQHLGRTVRIEHDGHALGGVLAGLVRELTPEPMPGPYPGVIHYEPGALRISVTLEPWRATFDVPPDADVEVSP